MNDGGRILVLADDFTGAAEIAGIGSQFGLETEIIRDSSLESTARLLVIDTDSRSIAPEMAAMRVKDSLRAVGASEFGLIFKKIDSLLRGPVLAELEAAMKALNRRLAILAPANPSRGRTIQNGEYRVDGTPLHQTALANDPEYPRRSSRVCDLIGPIPAEIMLADLANEHDVQRWAEKVDSAALPIGAADFFTAILRQRGLTPRMAAVPALTPNAMILMVCGSAAESSAQAMQNARARGIPILPCPRTLEDWPPAICRALDENLCAILTIGSESRAESPANCLAQAVAKVLSARDIAELLIEGGSTAAVILDEVNCQRFTDCRQLASGVVRMRGESAAFHITTKPGSYPWPDPIWKSLFAAALSMK